MSQAILITDDHNITRLGTSLICKKVVPDAELLEATNVTDMYQILKTREVRLLILDLFLEEFNCLSIIPEIMAFFPKLHVLVMTSADEELYGSRIVNSGATGYVNKLDSNDSIQTAIFRVYNGHKYISHNMYLSYINAGETAKKKNVLEVLSDKELEIANLLAKGYSVGEIADKSRLAISTVSTYKSRIYNKLHIDNVVALADLMKTQ